MTLFDLYRPYNSWKDLKKGMHAVTGSGAYKILQISCQVDGLISDYAAWKRKGSDANRRVSLRARLKQIKNQLSWFMTAAPEAPDIKPDMLLKYAKNVLETSNTAEMARNEWMRISHEQINETLPEDDDLVSWPATRSRLVDARDTWKTQAVVFTAQSLKLNAPINAARNAGSNILDVKKDPAVASDQSQIAQLEQDMMQWLREETDLKEQQRRLQAMAKVAELVCTNFNQQIEAGDLVHRELRKKSRVTMTNTSPRRAVNVSRRVHRRG